MFPNFCQSNYNLLISPIYFFLKYEYTNYVKTKYNDAVVFSTCLASVNHQGIIK